MTKKKKKILIVDDEKNIRLTLSEALSAIGLEPATAINGEEALAKLKEKDFDLILLDLKMPGIDGMEVLQKVSSIRPDIRIIIITAHGTIDSAVEAMKLGAADFIQKPFTVDEIRSLVKDILGRDKIDAKKAHDYVSYFKLAKKNIGDRHFNAAVTNIKRAISLDPSRPEAFNMLGVLFEIKNNIREAQKNYRTALDLDPSYEPAKQNLKRSTKGKFGR
jgi:DNA-binding NtrC family response regulator